MNIIKWFELIGFERLKKEKVLSNTGLGYILNRNSVSNILRLMNQGYINNNEICNETKVEMLYHFELNEDNFFIWFLHQDGTFFNSADIRESFNIKEIPYYDKGCLFTNSNIYINPYFYRYKDKEEPDEKALATQDEYARSLYEVISTPFTRVEFISKLMNSNFEDIYILLNAPPSIEDLMSLEESRNQHYAESIGEYLDLIAKIANENNEDNISDIWFRGHNNAKYDLLANFFYLSNSNNHTEFCFNERNTIDEFKANCFHRLDSQPLCEYEWLTIMQHYGMPTRLLDWTTDPLIALAFAVCMDLDEKEFERWKIDTNLKDGNSIETEPVDAAVYLLFPREFNKRFSLERGLDCKFIEKGGIPILNKTSELLISPLFKKKYGICEYCEELSSDVKIPLAINVVHNNDRIVNQKGKFLIFPKNTIDDLTLIADISTKNYLHKIVIKKEAVKQIRLHLKLLQVTISKLYPELAHAVKDLKANLE